MDAPVQARSRAEILLDEAARLLLPLARLLIRHGVGHGALAGRLKQVFLDAAEAELAAQGGRRTDSAVSLLSGLHRKDVRAARAAPRAVAHTRGLSFAAQVFTRWLHDPALRDAAGRLLPLPRAGAAPSFEALVAAVSTDFHPRSVLDELTRLGVVALDGEQVVPRATAFVPGEGFEELAYYLGANVADHLAAGAANLGGHAAGTGPRFLEQSVFADGLSASSADALGDLARELWRAAFDRMVAEASARCEQDQADPDSRRIRFGVYFYAEPATPTANTEGHPQ